MDSPLYAAITSNCKEIVEMLVDYDANINAFGQEKQTLLHIAARYEGLEIV